MNSPMTTVYAYAFISHAGNIDIKTITDTKRGVQVNALVTLADTFIMQAHTDQDINRLFHEKLSEVGRVSQVAVTTSIS